MTTLTLELTDLNELPEKWQTRIQDEMDKQVKAMPKMVEKAADGFVPPQTVRSNAKRGLELREKYGRGGTSVGVARARDLSNGKALSYDTIKRMNSYFARHEVDKKGEGWGKDSAGYIAWLLWGGDAGWSWARGIIRSQESKEKSTMNDLTTSYFGIEKADKNPDGTLTVYGKATDDSVDIDQQICDADWLERAMPHWFKTGGNIREQHSNIAAGVAKEYELKKDGHYITALVVDPVSAKKVETGVLKGFSIGIKNPRVTRDNKAANGRIVDGQIVEVSLVDRPANPNCQLVLAKSATGEDMVVQVEELYEKADKKPDYESINAGGEGSEPADKELYNRVKREAKEKFDVYPSAVANAWIVREYKKRGGKYKRKTEKAVNDLDLPVTNERESMSDIAKEAVELSKSFLGSELLKFDRKTYDTARQALAQLIAIEAEELGEGHDEQASLTHLIAAVHHLFAWYEGEKAEGEVEEVVEDIELAAHKDDAMKDPDPDKKKMKKDPEPDPKEDAEDDDDDFPVKKGESKDAYMKRCKDAGKSDSFAKKCWDKYMAAKEPDPDAEKSAEVKKCLECGCNQPGTDHGLSFTNDFANVAKPSHVTTAEMYTPDQTPKSAEPDEKETEDSADEPKSTDVEAIVEEAIKSATQSIRTEIEALMSAREAAESRAMSLETELAAAKSLAVAGGPKRTAKPVAETSNDLLVKSAMYSAKAKATTDPTLAKGYRALAEKFAAEHDTLNK